MKEEGLQETPNKLIHIGKPIEMNEEIFFERLKDLKEDAYEEVEAVFAHPEQIEALSVLPLADTNRVSIANVVWPLNNALLKQLHAYAISNVLLAGNNKCTCSCQEGKVAFYIKWRTEKNEY